MARNNGIEYIRFYTSGTAAQKLEPEEPRKPRRPAPRQKKKRIPIAFDPVAVFGTTVAIVMVLCVIIGFAQHNHMNDQITAMEQQISALKSQQYALEKKYSAGIDLEDIRQTANAMGLVPIEEVRHITITIPEPEVEETLPWWQELWMNFKAMFE